MSPDELRLLTDPSARNDPDFVRRVRNTEKRERRRNLFQMLRITSLVMAGVGPLLLVISGVLALGAIASALFAGSLGGGVMGMRGPMMLIPMVAPVLGPAIAGAVLSGLAFWLWVPGRRLLTTGMQGQATVLQVLAIGNGIRVKGGRTYGTVVKATVALRVMPPNGAPYELTHKEPILDVDIAALQVGATIPVRISPTNASKLLIDWDAIH